MEFKDKVVIITGSVHGIGKQIKEDFINEGARVYDIDMDEGAFYKGDIASKDVLECFVQEIIKNEKKIDIIINNALPIMKGIDECSYEDFEYALKVGTTAPFYLTKLLKDYFNDKASIINISSTRDSMSQAQSESYSAAKGGISALTHALSISLAGKARVNAISPGWIDTDFKEYIGSDAYQHPVHRVGNPKDISNMVLYLTSSKAGFITGQNIVVDGGMTKRMIYNGDEGWSLKE